MVKSDKETTNSIKLIIENNAILFEIFLFRFRGVELTFVCRMVQVRTVSTTWIAFFFQFFRFSASLVKNN
jgi:hypothetical protein